MRLEEAIKSSKFINNRHKASVNLLFTNYWLKNRLSSALKENGITLEQHNVLRILNGKHPEQMCVKDIASRMVEKSSNVPRIIDRLCAKKLAKRSTSKVDKRETLITLTDTGIQLLKIASQVVNDLSIDIGLTEQEAEIFNELLEKMRATGSSTNE